jgi:CMP-N,N'-diacetyllegionaminic acid synthase
MESVIALIPARGGSKSIPKKNLVQVAGKPLIDWTIEVARESKLIDRVIVSTDCDEIAKFARAAGAEVPFIRPSEFASDTSLDLDVFKHAANWLMDNEGRLPGIFVHLRPTEPARKVGVVDAAIANFLKNPEFDSLRSVNVALETPYKMWFIKNDALLPVLNPAGDLSTCSMPRQQLPTAYHQNGYVDIVRISTILEKDSMIGDKVHAFLIHDPITSIDYLDDIPTAEKEILQAGMSSIESGEGSWSHQLGPAVLEKKYPR